MANKYTAADELLAKLERFTLEYYGEYMGAPYMGSDNEGRYVRFEDVRQMLHESVDDALMNRDE